MMLGEVPVLSLFDRPISGLNHAVKWFEDKFIALFVLGLIWPLLVLVGIAIKLDSPGPVFFRQPREGYNNRSFHVLKFRSEEHTSELQSLMRISYAVFCLKKKKHTNDKSTPNK